jgi:23S rRNA (guanosine2251-2'-O)-methyltransferase
MQQKRNPSSNIIVGRNPVVEALRSGKPIEKILFAHGLRGAAVEKVRHLARQRGVPCSEVGKSRLQELAGEAYAQGIVAVVGMQAYVDVEDILAEGERRGEPAFILVLDGIEDPQNLGAIIRTAECAGVHGVIIPKHSAASVTESVVRASAGATAHVLVARVTNLASTLEELKERGVWVVGAAAEAGKSYTEIDSSGATAIVIGSEGKGIRPLVREKCDYLVRIPMRGKVSSLNASVAGALLMYEVVRCRRKIAGPQENSSSPS